MTVMNYLLCKILPQAKHGKQNEKNFIFAGKYNIIDIMKFFDQFK